MKIITAFILLFFTAITATAQDSTAAKHIDVLVSKINQSALPVINDSLSQQFSEANTTVVSYTSKLRDANALYKYTTRVVTKRTDHGVTSTMENTSTYYFEKNKLIKVEEYTLNGSSRNDMSWYYTNNKPVYWTLQAPKSADRAKLLLTMADDIVKKMGF